MEDETHTLTEKAQELGDLELAVLLCLVSNEHCIIEAEPQDLDKAERELQSICDGTFGLKSAVVRLDKESTLGDFSVGVLVQDDERVVSPIRARGGQKESFFALGDAETRQKGANRSVEDDNGEMRIADVVIVKNMHLARSQVQIQALELMRSGRIYTRKSMYTTPKKFLLIALNNEESGPRMVVHLNDHFHISHFYQPADEAQDQMYNMGNGSTGSVVRSRPATPGFMRSTSYRSYLKPLISRTDIETLATLASKAKLHPDVRAYIHNIVVFLRMHRAIASGVTPHATRHLYALTHALAPLHGLDFITPSLVALAVRKIYPHRLVIVAPEDEMSLQWGSEVEAVREYLDGITGEDVIEDVLERVETPL